MIFQQCLMARGESSHPGSSWKSCNTLAGIHPNRWKTHGKGWSQRDGSIRSISLVVSNNHCQTDVPIFLKHAHNSGPNMNRSWTGTVSQGGCLDISYMNGSISCRFFFAEKIIGQYLVAMGHSISKKVSRFWIPRTCHFIRGELAISFVWWWTSHTFAKKNAMKLMLLSAENAAMLRPSRKSQVSEAVFDAAYSQNLAASSQESKPMETPSSGHPKLPS